MKEMKGYSVCSGSNMTVHRTDKGMVSTRVGLMRNEVAGQSEGPIGTLKIGVKSATELEIF